MKFCHTCTGTECTDCHASPYKIRWERRKGMSSTFVTADLHLGHTNCAKWRGFKSVEEHDETIIENWNSLITKRDCVYILGDVGINPRDLHLVKRLLGHKKLILGNHEHHAIQRYADVFSWVKAIHVWKKKFLLTHVPIHPHQLENRWSMVNIHGHLHNGATIDDERYLNVNTENTGYKPVDLQVIAGQLAP